MLMQKMTELLQYNWVTFIATYVGMIIAFTYQVVGNLVLLLVPRQICFRRKDVRGQKILITGAGSGLGRQLAVEFSKHATCLILVDINRQSLLQTEKLLDSSSTVLAYECDVSDYREVCEMAQKVKRDAGDVDILVNNAGIVTGKYLVDLAEEQIVRTFKVNALAHFWTVKAFLPAMMHRNSGHVVSIISGAGKIVCHKMTDYCSSKSAASAFAECLEIELREQKLDGIKITIVYPSHMDTGLFEGFKTNLGTTMTPEYVAKQIVLGVLEEKEQIYLPTWVECLTLLKECFPRWFMIKLGEITGNIKVMKNFTGRKIKNLSKSEGAY